MPEHFEVFQNGNNQENEDNMVYVTTIGRAGGDEDAAIQTQARALVNPNLVREADRDLLDNIGQVYDNHI